MLVLKKIFKYESYRDYLNSYLGEKGKRTGLKSKMAKAIGIHSSHLSLILGGQTNLSLEQTEKLSLFLEHSELEKKALMLLVLKERAGTDSLTDFFDQEFGQVCKKYEDLSERFADASRLPPGTAEQYYSHWIYGAVHMVVTIPEFANYDSLRDYLQLPDSKLREIVDFLCQSGILSEENGRLEVRIKHIELGKGGNELRHHINFRSLAMNHIAYRRKEDVHYSAMMTMSESLSKEVRDKILAVLEESTHLCIPSEPEDAYVLAVDFFSLRQ